MSDAGVIEYTVSVETQASIDAANKVNESLNKTEKAMKDTESASGKLGGGMKKMATSVKRANVEIAESNKRFSALGKVIGSVIAFMGGKAVIDMADQYMEMSSRLKGATADTEEYEKVQARLLQTANNTYRPLQEAAEVYIRTSKAIKDLGYNTDQVLDITDSFSYLLVTNSASAERGASAINSYSKAIQTGRVDSMTWQSILAAMPSVVEDIATATGSTEAAIRKLGIEGKLSLGALNEALLRSKDKNLELADAMDTTVGDAMVAFRNSMTVFIGKVNESSGASAGLVTAVEDMSAILQDPATIKAAQDLAVGVVNAFSSIISAVKTTVEVVKWGAESMAAFMNGAALDDVVRLQDEIERYNKMLANPLTRLEFGGGNRKGGWLSEADINENIGTRKKHIEDYYKSQAEMYAAEQKKLKDILDNPASAPDVSAPVAAEAANDKVSKSLGRRTAARKQLTEEEKRAAQFAKKLADAEKQNIDVMDKLAESIYQTFLNADELVKRQAELSLNQYATPEQVEMVRKMAGELQKLKEVQSRKDAFKDGTGSTIRGDVPVLSGGAFDDGTARYEAEAQAERQRYAEQLERLVEAEELKLEVVGGYDLMREELYQEHSDRMAEIDRVRSEMQLTQWAQGFGDMASNLQDFAQVFGKENKAMFAMSKAAAIAQAVINTYQSATAAMASMSAIPIIGPALGIAAAAAAVMGGMAQVARIRSQTMGGGRLYGGPVSDNKYYKVNEDGRPEMFKGKDGSQYMMPNQRGEVISHDDAIGASSRTGSTVNVTQNISMRSDNGNYTAKQVMLESANRQAIAEARLG